MRSTPLTILLLLVVGLLGCAPTEIDRTYGKRRGAPGGSSVNGTAVLSAMFREAGFRVRSWRRLSPRLDQADVIVWFPDDFEPPTTEQLAYLQNWLANGTERTLIYVGRDYDAAISYWNAVRDDAPPEQAVEVTRRLATIKSEFDRVVTSLPATEETEWFSIRRDLARKTPETLSGDWSEGIDAAKVDIEITTRIEPPADTEVTMLLEAGDTPIAFRRQPDDWSDGQLLVVANGSFLLNLPLVNHEHRKLAGKLVAACSGDQLIFLESGAGGPAVLEHDPDATYATGLEMFTVPPLGTIVLHFAIMGITLCIACFPIFGRPHELKPKSTSDFGQHVSAFGELLERTQDRDFALDALKYYHEHVKKDTPAS